MISFGDRTRLDVIVADDWTISKSAHEVNPASVLNDRKLLECVYMLLGYRVVAMRSVEMGTDELQMSFR